MWWIGHARMLAHEGDGESCPCCLKEFWSPLGTAVIVTRIPVSLPCLALGLRSICRARNPVRELLAIQGRSREPQRQQQCNPQRCQLGVMIRKGESEWTVLRPLSSRGAINSRQLKGLVILTPRCVQVFTSGTRCPQSSMLACNASFGKTDGNWNPSASLGSNSMIPHLCIPTSISLFRHHVATRTQSSRSLPSPPGEGPLTTARHSAHKGPGVSFGLVWFGCGLVFRIV